MMPVAALAPNGSVIRAHLNHVVRRWPEFGRECLLEVRFLTSDDDAQIKDVSRYTPTAEGLELAASHIEAMNKYKLNAYIVVNPIDAAAPIKAGKGATDADIVGSVFHWADADDAIGAENIKSFVGPRPTFFVLTGTKPCTRPHVYWELESPTINLVAWNATQKSIAARLKTDPTVVNASRIMRVAGTVNWPKPKKIAKGYIQEITELHIHGEADRPRVSMERMARAFGDGQQSLSQMAAPVGPRSDVSSEWGGASALQIDTGPQRKSAEQYADILRRARTDGEKHGGVRDLAAHLAGSGVARAMAEAIIKDACPVWDQGVETLIDTAYAKFTPQVQPAYTPNFDHAPAPTVSDPAPAAKTWRMQTASEFTADFVAPEYIVDGVIQRGRLYTMTAPTGSGKTAVMLYAATAIAEGHLFYDREVESGDVIFMAGENPDDVRARMIGTMEYHGINPDTCRVHFIPGTFSIRADMERLREEAAKLPNLVLIVIDTFAAYFDGDDENSNAQSLDFARVARQLTAFPSKPAVVMPAHPVKNATKSNLAPKGGSSLVNEVDGNLTIWNEGGIVSMHWQVKFRGPDFEPLSFELQRHESDLIKDAKGRRMPTILAKPMLIQRAVQLARDNMSMEDKLLLSIADAPALSLADRAVNIGAPHKMKVKRMLEKMRGQKLIRMFRTNWELTKDGERAVEIITSGGQFAPEI